MDSVNDTNDGKERTPKHWTPGTSSKARKLAGIAALPLLSLLIVVLSVSGRDTDSSAAGSKEAGEATPVAGSYLAILKGRVDLESGIVRLAASRDGIIREVLVNEGERVSKGQVLATLDDTKVLRVGRIFGQPEPTDDPATKADIRTVECVLSIDQQQCGDPVASALSWPVFALEQHVAREPRAPFGCRLLRSSRCRPFKAISQVLRKGRKGFLTQRAALASL